MLLLLTLPALAVPAPALPSEPAPGHALLLARAEEAALLTPLASHLELDVGLADARLTWRRDFELPPGEGWPARVALPAGALLLAAALVVDGRPVDEPRPGPVGLELGALPGGARVTLTLDLALPVRWTGGGSRLELPGAPLPPAAPWLEAAPPEGEVSLWFGREVRGLDLDEGRLVWPLDEPEDWALEWVELEGSLRGGGGQGGASCGGAYAEGRVMGCAAALRFGAGGHGGLAYGSVATGCPEDPEHPEQPEGPALAAGVPLWRAPPRPPAPPAAARVQAPGRAEGAGGPGLLGGEAPPERPPLPEADPDDMALVDARLRRELNALAACYRRALRLDPALEGTVVLAFEVHEDGLIRGLRVHASSLGSPEVEACVLEQLAWTRFHQPARPFTARYPLRFRPEDDVEP